MHKAIGWLPKLLRRRSWFISILGSLWFVLVVRQILDRYLQGLLGTWALLPTKRLSRCRKKHNVQAIGILLDPLRPGGWFPFWQPVVCTIRRPNHGPIVQVLSGTWTLFPNDKLFYIFKKLKVDAIGWLPYPLRQKDTFPLHGSLSWTHKSRCYFANGQYF